MHQRCGPQLNRYCSWDSRISSALSEFAPIIHYNLTPLASTDLSTHPSTTPMVTKLWADLMSPISGFEPKDYNHDGLYPLCIGFKRNTVTMTLKTCLLNSVVSNWLKPSPKYYGGYFDPSLAHHAWHCLVHD